MNVLVFVSLALVAACMLYSRRRRSNGGRLPPGPPTLPILGNILQLGGNPHKSMTLLAKKYGPMMSLKLGSQIAVVVSSPAMATEMMIKHGQVFSNRSIPDCVFIHGHDHTSVNTIPTNSAAWKKLRRIAKECLFSNAALQRSEALRQERLRKLADHVRTCSEEGIPMNVGEATFATMFNLLFATLFSIDLTQYGHSDSAANQKFKAHVNAFTRYIGVPNICDFFPIFSPLDPQRIRAKCSHHFGSLLQVVDSMVQQRLQQRKSPSYVKKTDFLETLLDLMEGNEYELSIKEINHLFVDIIIGGSDSSAATAEWAMVELLLHPDKLAKVKEELRRVIGEKSMVEESDIASLPYLQATMKEAFRYHPVAPLLGPREAVEDTEVMGYTIPKNSKIIVNFWAITRDPTIWKNPESFEPERFLGNQIDYQGQYSELIPFGAGRRICPGMPLAGRMLHCMVATFCHNFDWKLAQGDQSKQLQREDVFGLSLQKKTPLWATPIKD